MLRKKDRGRDATLGLKSGDQKQQRFGEEAVGEIEGLDLLEKWKEEERQKKRLEKGLPADGSDEEEEDEEEDWNAWNIEEDEDSDDSGGWINVASDDEMNAERRFRTAPGRSCHFVNSVPRSGSRVIAV